MGNRKYACSCGKEYTTAEGLSSGIMFGIEKA